jgi:hypothetical protein
MNESETNASRWIDAFPWIERALHKAVIRQESSNSDSSRKLWLEAIDTASPNFESICLQLAGLASSQLPAWSLEQLFPALPLETVLKDSEIHGVDRESELFTKSSNFASISSHTLDQLEISNFLKIRSHPLFISSLSALNAKATVGESLLPSWRRDAFQFEFANNSFSAETTSGVSARGSEYDKAVLNAINTLMEWNRKSGQLGDNLVESLTRASESPDKVQQAAEFLKEINAQNWLKSLGPSVPVFELLEEFLDPLDLRSLRIIEGRVLSRPKVTLDTLGAEYGLTRERIRQLESGLLADLSSWFNKNSELQLHSEQIRSFTGSLNTLAAVLNAFPALSELINDLDLPAWYVFDQFDDSFESDGKWIAVPSLQDVAQEFDSMFDEFSHDGLYMDREEFNAVFSDWGNCTPNELYSWVLDRGYTELYQSLAHPSVTTRADRAYICLGIHGSPLTIDEIKSQINPDNPVRGLGDALKIDPRFKKVGPETWSLTEWGLGSYQGIRQEILNVVDAQGSASLAKLMEELPVKFDISPASVRTYATTWPLQTVGDIVTRATKPMAPTRPLHRSRGVYFVDNLLTFRVRVTSEHLRGSGFQVPSALAGAVGLTHGGNEVSFPDNFGSIFTLRWNALQPLASSIRSQLVEMDAAEDNFVTITFRDQSVEIASVEPRTGSVTNRLRSICLFSEDEEVSRKSIAARLGLPTTSLWSEIFDTCRARREEDLIEAVEEFANMYL